MSMKITGGPPAAGSIDELKDAGAAGCAKEADGASAAQGSDPVTEIAADLAAGRISPQVAVDRLVAHAMDSQMSALAPQELRARMEEALRVMIETDPHLVELARGLGVEQK